MRIKLLALLSAAVLVTACSQDDPSKGSVVVYVSIDQTIAEPVLETFARETGIEVKPVYDVEAAKTSGLAKRLAEEADTPRADVFWSGEPVQTEVMAQAGLFSPYLPDKLRPGPQPGPENRWVAFGGRARVFIINTARLNKADWPTSIYDLVADGRDTSRAVIAYPLFGTSATHASALFTTLGPERAGAFFDRIVAHKVRIVDGNSVVRDLVADGTADFGLTDTDDACSAFERKPDEVGVVFPDQAADGMGTLVIPNSVALVKGGPNPQAGKRLIDHLLSEAVADQLADAGWFRIDGTRVFSPETCGLPAKVKPMAVDYAALARTMGDVIRELRDRIVR
ncbi:extracellular solute-binding protein [Zhengella mangrovi]|nr:extracellular solute-binding protein [Zhengella mangrovi]